MTNDKKHIDNEAQQRLDQHLEKSGIRWSKSRDEVWAQMQNTIVSRRSNVRKLYTSVSVAATIVILLGLVAFMRFHTETVKTAFGQHSLVTLPDGTTVELNAATTLSWHPYWWRFTREAKFQGEGFFKVMPGSSFSVISSKGATTVLGTSFNIYARGEYYMVTCVTGKVRARAAVTDQKVVINPGQKAMLETSGTFTLENATSIKEITGWRNHMFTFTAMPLDEVLDEIMRQYNVNIIHPELNRRYTGFFSKSMDIETVLDLVCRPFEFTFVNTKERTYVISAPSFE